MKEKEVKIKLFQEKKILLNKQKLKIENNINKEKSQVLSKIIDLISEKQNNNEELKIKEMRNLIKDEELIEKIKDMKNKQKQIEKRIIKKYEFKPYKSYTIIKDESINEDNKDDEEEDDEEDSEENEESEEEYIKDSNFNMNIDRYFPIRSGVKSERDKEIKRRVDNLRKKLEKEYEEAKSKEDEKEEIRRKAFENETDEDKKNELKLINFQERAKSNSLLYEIEKSNEQKIKEFEEQLKKKI